jgi:hypothetical protein
MDPDGRQVGAIFVCCIAGQVSLTTQLHAQPSPVADALQKGASAVHSVCMQVASSVTVSRAGG